VEWRISYHDALDSVAGYPEGATLMMGRLKLRWRDGDTLQLQGFDPIAIRSLAPRDAFFKPISWQVNAGFERLENIEESMVARVSGGAGASVNFLKGVAYGLPGLRLEHNDDAEDPWRIAAQINVGQLWQGNVWATELRASYIDFGGGDDIGRGVRQSVNLGINRVFSAKQAMRLSLEYRKEFGLESTAAELAWRHYF
jgi:hypothetical protein